MDECKPLVDGSMKRKRADEEEEGTTDGTKEQSAPAAATKEGSEAWAYTRFLFQLNLSSYVHRITQSNSWTCPGVVQVEL